MVNHRFSPGGIWVNLTIGALISSQGGSGDSHQVLVLWSVDRSHSSLQCLEGRPTSDIMEVGKEYL